MGICGSKTTGYASEVYLHSLVQAAHRHSVSIIVVLQSFTTRFLCRTKAKNTDAQPETIMTASGMTAPGASNPLGRVSYTRPSAEALQRASVQRVR